MDFAGQRVTVLGLGLHGGGVETVRYLHRHGARVTVTDLRDRETLAPSLEAVDGCVDEVILGYHDEKNISDAAFVVKNPAVPRTAPVLRSARMIHTDISLFLAGRQGPLIAVTGTKGKSTVSSMIHAALCTQDPLSRLGGNITVSPLTFMDELDDTSPVVLELSSFQLGDLRLVEERNSRPVRLTPKVSIITNILRDHQDYYAGSMERYVSDKERIFRDQRATDTLVVGTNDHWAGRFADSAPCRVVIVEPNAGSTSSTALERNRRIAAEALNSFGMRPETVVSALDEYRGIEHRMEPVPTAGRIAVLNDSAATIPDATYAAVSGLSGPCVLLAGGTDKDLDLSPFSAIAGVVKHIVLLDGSATSRLVSLFEAEGIPYHGPFSALTQAFTSATQLCEQGDTLLFSPGCASFGLFKNEFDRGRAFKALVADSADAL